MILVIVPLKCMLLAIGAFKAKSAGRSRVDVALIVVIGTIGIVAATFGVLVWGFPDFG